MGSALDQRARELGLQPTVVARARIVVGMLAAHERSPGMTPVIRRDVAGGALRERGDAALPRRRELLLEDLRRVALVVEVDRGVVAVHARAVHAEPVDRAEQAAA